MNKLGKKNSPEGIILYDNTCVMCRSLAGFLQKRSAFAVMPWQDFALEQGEESAGKSPATLKVLLPEALLEGTAAWDYLLENYRDMDGLNWLAQKLGLRREAAAALEHTGHALRRLFCRRCQR